MDYFDFVFFLYFYLHTRTLYLRAILRHLEIRFPTRGYFSYGSALATIRLFAFSMNLFASTVYYDLSYPCAQRIHSSTMKRMFHYVYLVKKRKTKNMLTP